MTLSCPVGQQEGQLRPLRTTFDRKKSTTTIWSAIKRTFNTKMQPERRKLIHCHCPVRARSGGIDSRGQRRSDLFEGSALRRKSLSATPLSWKRSGATEFQASAGMGIVNVMDTNHFAYANENKRNISTYGRSFAVPLPQPARSSKSLAAWSSTKTMLRKAPSQTLPMAPKMLEEPSISIKKRDVLHKKDMEGLTGTDKAIENKNLVDTYGDTILTHFSARSNWSGNIRSGTSRCFSASA